MIGHRPVTVEPATTDVSVPRRRSVPFGTPGRSGCGPDGSLVRREGSESPAPGDPLAPLGFPALAGDLARLESALKTSVEVADTFLTDVATHLIGAGGKRLRPV